jgi:hypothetical protein
MGVVVAAAGAAVGGEMVLGGDALDAVPGGDREIDDRDVLAGMDAILKGNARSPQPMPATNREALKDRPAQVLCKRIVLLLWTIELGLRRALSRGWRRRYWGLADACRACGCCCEEPTIHGSPVAWHFPLVRRLFLAWQRRVNGLEFQRQAADSHDFIFRCTHFDPASRRCDSYASRPSMCRDYPTVLLGQAWPELFEACGYRIRARRPEGLRASIEATSLPPEAKAELRRKMRLE